MRRSVHHLLYIYILLSILICSLAAGCGRSAKSPTSASVNAAAADNISNIPKNDTGSCMVPDISGNSADSCVIPDVPEDSDGSCIIQDVPESSDDGFIIPDVPESSDVSCVIPTAPGNSDAVPTDSEKDTYADMNIPECIFMDDCTPEPAGMTGYSYPVDSYFYAVDIPDFIFSEISGKSFPAELAPEKLTELKYVHVLHYDFNGNICEGELIVNSCVADKVTDIFKELFDIAYPIEKIRLIDKYDGDDETSMRDNNTSAFNYRTVAGSSTLSKHALGLAIDINPLYNPYGKTRADGTVFVQPANAAEYLNRDLANPYYIRNEDDCCRIFKAHGFTWGGDWNNPKDYQHFEYPSD